MQELLIRLIDNLQAQIDVLEKIYLSDSKLIDRDGESGIDYEYLDEYLNEQDSLMIRLDELDKGYDRIYELFRSSADTGLIHESINIERISGYISEINEKAEAVRKIEEKARHITDKYISEKRNEISASRRNSRVIIDNYARNPIGIAGNASYYDSTN